MASNINSVLSALSSRIQSAMNHVRSSVEQDPAGFLFLAAGQFSDDVCNSIELHMKAEINSLLSELNRVISPEDFLSLAADKFSDIKNLIELRIIADINSHLSELNSLIQSAVNCVRSSEEHDPAGFLSLTADQFSYVRDSTESLMIAGRNSLMHSALKRVRSLEEQDPARFLSLAADQFSDGRNSIELRMVAGIYLKNSFDAKDSSRKDFILQQWVAFDSSIKSHIKESALRILRSSIDELGHIAAQLIAKIAGIELPRKEWPDLGNELIGYDLSLQALRPESLKTLGYMCEEISCEELCSDDVSEIFSVVVKGMNCNEPNFEVRLAATRALHNALGFFRTQFENEMEQNSIMEVVCESALCQHVETRLASYEIIVSIASMYYEVLEPYMKTLFELTSKAIREDEEAVALQAIEFWSSICEKELENQDSRLHFVQKYLDLLVPVLLETLLRQEEGQQGDLWNLSRAGGTCLRLVARTVGNAIRFLVISFIAENIVKVSDWRCFEAAIHATGSIIDGPDFLWVKWGIINGSLGFLIVALESENSLIRDTAAWATCRFYEQLHYETETPSSGLSLYANVDPEHLRQCISFLNDLF